MPRFADSPEQRRHAPNAVRVIEGEIIIVPLVAGIGDMDNELFTLSDTRKAIRDKLDADSFRMKSQTRHLVFHV